MSVLASRPQTPAQEPEPHDPAVRIARLLDAETMIPLRPKDSSGVLAARGRIDGAKVVVFCTDAGVIGGAVGSLGSLGSLDSAGCLRIVEAIDTAVRERCPVIGLWQGGCARLAEGVAALDGAGRVLAATVRASGRVPQLSLVLGRSHGGAGYGPALTDVVVLAPAGRMSADGAESGAAQVLAADEDDAYHCIRRITGLLAKPGRFDLHSVRAGRDLRSLVPKNRTRGYDVRPLISGILDADGLGAPVFAELHGTWAPNMVVGLGRLGGRTVGVVAGNPRHRGGCLDPISAAKAARFVRLCDAAGIPLLVLADVPGQFPGIGQEWDGMLRHGAQLLHAFAEAVVPRVTLITRKAYGDAAVAMNARCLGATAVFA